MRFRSGTKAGIVDQSIESLTVTGHQRDSGFLLLFISSLKSRLPEQLRRTLKEVDHDHRLTPFPLGSAFDKTEERLAVALQELANHAGSKKALAWLALRGWRRNRQNAGTADCLKRMGLERPATVRDRFYRCLLQEVLS